MMHSPALRVLTGLACSLSLLGKPLAGRAQVVRVGATRTYHTLAAAVSAGAVVSGTTVQIDDGTYSDVCVIRGLSNVTVTSTSGRAGKVIFDNQGLGNLALGGKAMIVVSNSPGFVARGLWFKNVGLGGAAGVAQQGTGAGNQAGIRFEDLTAAGTSRVSYCAFDNCVTGLFGGANITPLDLTIDHCDFGFNTSNGQARDGYSHDSYINHVNSLTCADNNWYGNLYANNCKSRSPNITVSGGYNANSNGRCVELPEGGHYSITGGIYVAAGRGQQPFDYAAENTNNGLFNGTISGITLRVAVPNATVWNNGTGTTMSFVNTAQEWYGTGTVALILRGPGAITGLATSGAAQAATPPPAPQPVSGIADPTISGFTPTRGNAGTTVTLSGTNFNWATQVRIGNVVVPNYTVNSPTSITFTVPGNGISGFISVVTPAATATSTAQFNLVTATRASQALPGLTVFPNPAADRFTVALPQAGAATVALRDLAGHLVLAPTPLAADQQLLLPAGLAAGVYLLEVRQGGITAVRRVEKN